MFINSVKTIYSLISKNIIYPVLEKDIFTNKTIVETFIFEGAQGILLDKNYGIKPHITKSNTTSRNALTILARQKDINFDTEIFYITRAYQTRHGAGPFRPKDSEFILHNNYSETNLFNEYQGEFKTGYLDVDMLNYALKCDMKFSNQIPKNLMVTCIDHLGSEEIVFYKNSKKEKQHYKELAKELLCNFKSAKFSFSNCAEFLC